MLDNIVGGLMVKIGLAINKRLSPIQRAKLFSHVFLPALLLGIPIYSGGWVAVGFERAIAISELRTEITMSGTTSSKQGFVVITEPEGIDLECLIPMSEGTSKFWSSLNEQIALENARSAHVVQNADSLYVKTPLIRVRDPMAVVVEGKLDDYIEIPGHGKHPLDDWRFSSRRPLSLIAAVLFNCFLALGIGLVTGFPAVKPDESNAS